jgi:hypothetical protein
MDIIAVWLIDIVFFSFLQDCGMYRGADKSLARPGRKSLTGHLHPRKNWPTWASNVLITHPILRIWLRQTTTRSLDWKSKQLKGKEVGLRTYQHPATVYKS